MNSRKIVAIVRVESLERVEERLRNMNVPGISVSTVKGFGQYANFFRNDWLVRHARLEVFADEAAVDAIVRAIHEEAHTGASGDGVIAVVPVERFIRIRDEVEDR